MSADLTCLRAAVQRNCHISDARHARSHTLCTYLLKMREFYRWEAGHAFNAPLPQQELGEWINEREALWERLEHSDFDPIPVLAGQAAPFETASINAELNARGLVYSGGYGAYGAAHFFLAELLSAGLRDGLPVLVAGHEHARDMAAPPAMLLDGTLFVRRESMRRMVWEKIEEWRWKRRQDAMARAMRHYDFDADFEQALERMTDNEVESALLHELGEWRAEAFFGEDWPAMLATLSGTRGEIVARAVRDHVADCVSTLPTLLERQNDAALHFYFANLKGMRRELFPELGEAYRRWIEEGKRDGLAAIVTRGAALWLETARRLVGLHHDHPETCAAEIGRMYTK